MKTYLVLMAMLSAIAVFVSACATEEPAATTTTTTTHSETTGGY